MAAFVSTVFSSGTSLPSFIPSSNAKMYFIVLGKEIFFSTAHAQNDFEPPEAKKVTFRSATLRRSLRIDLAGRKRPDCRAVSAALVETD
jgi:hypothetical protein